MSKFRHNVEFLTAWARICKILGAGFAPYLPMVMDPVMKTASMKPEVNRFSLKLVVINISSNHMRDEGVEVRRGEERRKVKR